MPLAANATSVAFHSRPSAFAFSKADRTMSATW